MAISGAPLPREDHPLEIEVEQMVLETCFTAVWPFAFLFWPNSGILLFAMEGDFFRD